MATGGLTQTEIRRLAQLNRQLARAVAKDWHDDADIIRAEIDKIMAGKVTIGLTFPYLHADSNPLWQVDKARGGNTWECVVTADSPDWAGTRKVFGGEEILRAVASQTFWTDMHDTHESWWNARKIGEIVHYHNGFGQYVRGRIVWEVSEEFPKGRNVMVPTELVGNWRDYDLPRINAAGTLILPHHVRQIRDAVTMQPNFSNMVEAVGVRDRDGEDPRGKPALDLTTPAPNSEQVEAARLSAIREQVQELLNVEHNPHDPEARPYSEALREALIQARDMLATWHPHGH